LGVRLAASNRPVYMPQSSSPKHLNKRNPRLDLFLLLSIAVLSVIEFQSFLSSNSFGSEFTQFFMFVRDRSFGEMMQGYVRFNVGWYRPTQFFLPYWIGEQFISWRNPGGWRAFNLFTIWMVCGLIYWFVLTLLPGCRIAAFAAAFYFTCVPVLYAALYELGSFDFPHIVFGLLSSIAFIRGYRSRGWRGIAWTLFAWVSYVIALTSKEIAIVIPAYLTVLSVILYFYEPRVGETKEWILREMKRLVPFWAMIGVYWAVHVRKIPADPFGGSSDYRFSPNWELIIRNANKFPLWLARIYGHTLDSQNQAAGYTNWRNDLVGAVALALVCYACFRLWRTGPEYRKYILLSVTWIAVFLMVPIYSGGYFWHGNLALCGYSMLFGVAVDWLITRIPSSTMRYATGAFLIAGVVALARADVAECLTSGIHSETYRINSTILNHPPVPFDRMSGAPLVYVEDRDNQSTWSFGAGSLFNLVYLNRNLTQVVVPVMNKVSFEDRVRWLKHKNAFFFRYDNQYRWIDATEQFRTLALAKTGDQPVPPKITTLGPSETHAGVGFNVQPDGSSALGVTGWAFESGAKIILNGQVQPTMFGSEQGLTTTVPRELYSRPGTITIQVRNPNGMESNTSTLRVLQ